jgi:N-formylglutamate amidohydrolase
MAMDATDRPAPDSYHLGAGAETTISHSEGGAIPGEGGPAFVLQQAVPAPIPVVLAVPHAGRSYPPALLAAMRHPAQAARRLEDRLVDLVAQAVARQTGAALLIARAPRAMIDLNRAPDDLDREMIVPDPALADFPPVPRSAMAARRAQSGLGLVPRRLAGLGEIWRQRTPAADVQARSPRSTPYHQALSGVLSGLAARWGLH